MNRDVKHKVFIPITDEMLYDYPQLITAPLRPYKVDNPCYHWMATIESCGQNGQHPVEAISHTDYRLAVSGKSGRETGAHKIGGHKRLKQFQDSHDNKLAI